MATEPVEQQTPPEGGTPLNTEYVVKSLMEQNANLALAMAQRDAIIKQLTERIEEQENTIKTMGDQLVLKGAGNGRSSNGAASSPSREARRRGAGANAPRK